MMRFLRTLSGRSEREAETSRLFEEGKKEREELKGEINAKVKNIAKVTKEIEAAARLMRHVGKDISHDRR